MSSSEEISWISWFCERKGNEFFCEVDEEYINDKFNLYGLKYKVPYYNKALNIILDIDSDDELGRNIVEDASEMLYGLIHARYILTNKGMEKMMTKYQSGRFGRCSRFYCFSQRMLPIGLSDAPGEAKVKLYCPKCNDVYEPALTRHQNIDGAYFGTGFPHMFFMEHPESRPLKPTKTFVPRLFGFKIHPRAYELQEEASRRSSNLE